MAIDNQMIEHESARLGELSSEAPKIVIVGGGIAGNNLAGKLANEGFNPTLITRIEDQSDFDIRPSAPIISKNVATRVGIDFEIDNAVDAISSSKENQGYIANLVQKGVSRYIRKHPHTAIDVIEAARTLQNKNSQNPKINIIQGTFTDVEMEGKKIIGVKYKTGDEVHALPVNLVIDSTGRNAAVARQVEIHQPGAISERKLEIVQNQVIGGYISFDKDAVGESFPDVDKTMYVGALRKGVFTVISPTIPLEGSNATHLILVEGDPGTIRKFSEEAQSILGPHASTSEIRLEALKQLSQGTAWEKLAKSIKTIDRTIFFMHKEDKARAVDKDVEGLALIGDAGSYTNPIFGTGVQHGADDVDRLVMSLKGIKNVKDLSDGVAYYNLEQERADQKRLIRSKSIYNSLGFVRKALNTMSRLKNKSNISEPELE